MLVLLWLPEKTYLEYIYIYIIAFAYVGRDRKSVWGSSRFSHLVRRLLTVPGRLLLDLTLPGRTTWPAGMGHSMAVWPHGNSETHANTQTDAHTDSGSKNVPP